MRSAPPDTPKPRRRWLQFSLRTMVLLMAVFAVGFGWLAHQVQQARAQQKAETAIEELGGYVGYPHLRHPCLLVRQVDQSC